MNAIISIIKNLYAILIKSKNINHLSHNRFEKIAHDLKSPIITIEYILSITPEIPEKKRELLTECLHRLIKIADNLTENKSDVIPKMNENFTNEDSKTQPIAKQKTISSISDSPLVISIIDDEEIILKSWQKTLGSSNVFFFKHPDDFNLAFIDDPHVKKTDLIITDYYFNNASIKNLLDMTMLKQALQFNGKIFLFSNVQLFEDNSNFFDYVFQNKKKYMNIVQLKNIIDTIESKNKLT